MSDDPAPVNPGLVRMTTPMNPTMSPTTPLTRIGSSGRNRDDRTIAKSGTGEVRIAASDDSTDCSAQVMSRNGMVMLMIAITMQVAVDPPLARQRLVGQADDRPEQRGADDQPECDERERPVVVDGELDEQVARAPDEPEGRRR